MQNFDIDSHPATLHPGEVNEDVQDKMRPLAPHYKGDIVPYFFNENPSLHNRMYMVRKYREADENIEHSFDRYINFRNTMGDHDVDSYETDEIYSLIGTKFNELLGAIDGAHSYQDVTDEIQKIAVDEFFQYSASSI